MLHQCEILLNQGFTIYIYPWDGLRVWVERGQQSKCCCARCPLAPDARLSSAGPVRCSAAIFAFCTHLRSSLRPTLGTR